MFKRVSLVVLAFLATFSLYLYGESAYYHYKSWQDLSSTHIAEATQWHITNRAEDIDGVTAICVYAVDCSGDRARLAIVRNLDEYDFDALKQRIWDRRFNGTCEGLTANLGLHIVRSRNSGEYDYSDHAYWSFSNDRFLPKERSWSGGSFSEEPWERCTMEKATFLVQDGVVGKAAN